MTQFDDDAVDELMRLVGTEMECADHDVRYQSEAALQWLAQDARDGRKARQRNRDADDADAFASSVSACLAIRRAERRLPSRPLSQRSAPVMATVSQAMAIAGDQRCATMLDLAAAAGTGRAIWDEPCESWLELPPDVPSSRHVALRVEGDSMEPVLAPRDVILVKLDAAPVVDDLVVARLADDGFVVKRVASLSGGNIMLASFNPVYEPIVARRDQVHVLGTVIARFRRE
jgi:phage repressor protein C with HTH and peptisase S24 domain